MTENSKFDIPVGKVLFGVFSVLFLFLFTLQSFGCLPDKGGSLTKEETMMSENKCKCGEDGSEELHSCLFNEAINDDHETMCNCCPECETGCVRIMRYFQALVFNFSGGGNND